jgi:hypothetical protein
MVNVAPSRWEKAFRLDLLVSWGGWVWAVIQPHLLWVVPLVTGALAAWLAGLERQPLSWLFLFGLYGASGGVLLVGAFVGVGHYVYRRLRTGTVPHSPPPSGGPLEQWDESQTPVIGRTFQNERVEIDNRMFDKCRFKNVSFVFKGRGPSSFINCQFDLGGESTLETEHPVAKSFLSMVLFMQSMPGIGSRMLLKNPDTGEMKPFPLPEYPQPKPPQGQVPSKEQKR